MPGIKFEADLTRGFNSFEDLDDNKFKDRIDFQWKLHSHSNSSITSERMVGG